MAERTVLRYWACVRKLSEHFAKSPDEVTPEELRQYFLHLKTVKKVARQTSTQSICAIKLFWEKTLKQRWPAEVELVRANPRFKLPVVLSAPEVRLILSKVPALDHRVALVTIYSCGLRLGEGLNVQVGDIDSERMLLHIRNGKGGRDRYVPLPERTLELLRQQWKTHRHEVLLFPAKVWKQRWIVHCQPAGSGENTLGYLSRYIFKTATGNRKVQLLANGKVRWS